MFFNFMFTCDLQEYVNVLIGNYKNKQNWFCERDVAFFLYEERGQGQFKICCMNFLFRFSFFFLAPTPKKRETITSICPMPHECKTLQYMCN